MMLTLLRKIFLPLLLALAAVSPAQASEPACHGRFFNPITDPNWNNFFPVTVFGISLGSNSNPPLMREPAICVCPGGLLGLPMIGIGVTYWSPMYIGEVERDPGCLSTLGGMKILSSYNMERAEKQTSSSDAGTISRMQMHWYEYPLFRIMDLFTDFVCDNSSVGFDLAWLTEIDPTWQNDSWGAIFNPEGALFANPLAQASCAVDSVAASFYFPIDPMFWCVGTFGSLYPMTGSSPHYNSDQSSNGLILGKFVAKLARIGALMGTIGPSNTCNSNITPIWVKSQFRLNQINPVPVNGNPVYFGQTEFRWGYTPPANAPTKESSAYLLWNGQQCCIRVLGVETVVMPGLQ